MKKQLPTIPLLTLAFATMLFVISCKKEISSDILSLQEEENAATYSVESDAESDVAFNDVYDNVMGVNADLGVGGTGVFGRVGLSENGRVENTDSLAPCVTVTIVPQTPGLFPKTVTIDFGAGCFSHGHLRSGKIKTVFTGRLVEPGSAATTTFDNFKIDSVQVAGTHKITNTTATTPGINQRQFKIEVIDGKRTKPNGNYSEWSSVRTRTQVEGNGSVTPLDDLFKVTGLANGKVVRNNLIVLWNSEITEPLIKKFVCPWISKGRIRTARQGLASNSPWVAVLDYGSGTCDNAATLTINGSTHQITLH